MTDNHRSTDMRSLINIAGDGDGFSFPIETSASPLFSLGAEHDWFLPPAVERPRRPAPVMMEPEVVEPVEFTPAPDRVTSYDAMHDLLSKLKGY